MDRDRVAIRPADQGHHRRVRTTFRMPAGGMKPQVRAGHQMADMPAGQVDRGGGAGDGRGPTPQPQRCLLTAFPRLLDTGVFGGIDLARHHADRGDQVALATAACAEQQRLPVPALVRRRRRGSRSLGSRLASRGQSDAGRDGRQSRGRSGARS